MYNLKLDFDGALPRDWFERVRALFRWVGGRPAVIGLWRTRHGWHVLIETRARWAAQPVAVIAAQAVLGSDPKREMFNLMRAVRSAEAAPMWRKRLNVFYVRKLKEPGNGTRERAVKQAGR